MSGIIVRICLINRFTLPSKCNVDIKDRYPGHGSNYTSLCQNQNISDKFTVRIRYPGGKCDFNMTEGINTRGHDLNRLRRGPLNNATHKISKRIALIIFDEILKPFLLQWPRYTKAI